MRQNGEPRLGSSPRLEGSVRIPRGCAASGAGAARRFLPQPAAVRGGGGEGQGAPRDLGRGGGRSWSLPTGHCGPRSAPRTAPQQRGWPGSSPAPAVPRPGSSFGSAPAQPGSSPALALPPPVPAPGALTVAVDEHDGQHVVLAQHGSGARSGAASPAPLSPGAVPAAAIAAGAAVGGQDPDGECAPAPYGGRGGLGGGRGMSECSARFVSPAGRGGPPECFSTKGGTLPWRKGHLGIRSVSECISGCS